MKVLVEELKSSTPRPKSPHMNNEEPINYSHYPDGHPPNGNDEVDKVLVKCFVDSVLLTSDVLCNNSSSFSAAFILILSP